MGGVFRSFCLLSHGFGDVLFAEEDFQQPQFRFELFVLLVFLLHGASILFLADSGTIHRQMDQCKPGVRPHKETFTRTGWTWIIGWGTAATGTTNSQMMLNDEDRCSHEVYLSLLTLIGHFYSLVDEISIWHTGCPGGAGTYEMYQLQLLIWMKE